MVTTFSVVIKEGFCWDVVLPHGVSIPKTSHLFQQQEHLHDDKVISVLHDLDAPVCVGNGNNKFHALKQWKSGRFLGRSKHRKYVPPPPPPPKKNNQQCYFDLRLCNKHNKPSNSVSCSGTTVVNNNYSLIGSHPPFKPHENIHCRGRVGSLCGFEASAVSNNSPC